MEEGRVATVRTISSYRSEFSALKDRADPFFLHFFLSVRLKQTGLAISQSEEESLSWQSLRRQIGKVMQ
jgi:hypothetical protein